MKSRRAASFLLGVTALVSACATAGSKTGSGAGHDPLVINADEINPVNQAHVIDVVKQVRPNWLTMNSSLGSGIKRATGFAVYEDNRRVGDLGMLSVIPTSEVLSIRFYDTNHAAALPGMGSDVVLGAIVLTMRH